MSDPVLSLDTFTYQDYKTWPEDFRCELIDGVVCMMASPLLWHQQMVLKLGTQLAEFFEGKPCQPFIAPVDVRLFPQDDESDDDVVQPDLIVVCDEKKLADGKACKGAPDLVIEVLSSSTRHYDLVTKLEKYRKAGVREYWIIGNDAVRVIVFDPYQVREWDLKKSREVKSVIFPALVLRF